MTDMSSRDSYRDDMATWSFPFDTIYYMMN